MKPAAQTVVEAAKQAGQTIATAESCTGGLIGAALTDVPGASSVFTHGFITYANEAKVSMLRVPDELLSQHGAVSEPVAEAMAIGAINAAGADASVAVTGVAGPGGGTREKPVGLVYIATARKTESGAKATVVRHLFDEGLGRDGIRDATVDAALEQLSTLIADA